MGTLYRSVLLTVALVAAGACSKPFTAPPRSVTTLAVLPPNNLTGDPLLVAGGSFLEQYAFKTERITVPEALLAETRTFLERRGYKVVSGETVAGVTGAKPPASVADAARVATELKVANVLYIEIRRWGSDDRSTPQAIIVSIQASLVEPSGHVVWQADRPAKPVQTEGAIGQGTAYMIAIQKIVDELFVSWGTT
jgi:hypothetical protein